MGSENMGSSDTPQKKQPASTRTRRRRSSSKATTTKSSQQTSRKKQSASRVARQVASRVDINSSDSIKKQEVPGTSQKNEYLYPDANMDPNIKDLAYQTQQAKETGGAKKNEEDDKENDNTINGVDKIKKADKTVNNDDQDSLKSAKKSTRLAVTISISSIVIVVAIVGLLFSIFVWPRWTEPKTAADKAKSPDHVPAQVQLPPATASMSVPLPANASTLLQAMPDVVGIYARKGVTPDQSWAQLQPNEEYSIKYEGSDPKNAVTVILAQWQTPESARSNYQKILSGFKGKTLRSGEVSVSGQTTGEYRFMESASDPKEGIALWRNATCIFEVRGPVDQVGNFYQEFPL